jgi:DNA-binding SARP family transcriptional activator
MRRFLSAGAVVDAVDGATQFAERAVERSGATPAVPVQVRLFGGLTLRKRGLPVAWRGGARTEALLLSLALEERRGVPRDRLLSQVWPDGDVALAVQSLHSLVHSLNQLLGDGIHGALPVVHAGEIYRLNVEAGIAVDITTFDALARRGEQHWRAGDWSAASNCYTDAVALYRGDIHACSDDSAIVERERLRALYLVMLGRLADVARRDGDYSAALEYASRVLKYDAEREDAHRTLMYCYARLGQRVQALRQYQLCERLLRETFDAVPEPATRSLFDRLRLDPAAVLEEV